MKNDLRKQIQNRKAIEAQMKNDLRDHKQQTSNLKQDLVTSPSSTQWCPFKTCSGVIDLEQSKCMMCNKKVCRRCGTQDGITHKCAANNMASVQSIQNDKKISSCPACYVNIYKVNGCNQMWCTQCHTKFVWTKGKISAGTDFENPHFSVYTQNGETAPRVARDVPYGGVPDLTAVTDPVVRCISNAIQGIPNVKVEFDRQLHIANNAKKIIFKKYTLRKVQEDKAKKQCEIHPGNRAILDDLQAKIIKEEEKAKKRFFTIHQGIDRLQKNRAVLDELQDKIIQELRRLELKSTTLVSAEKGVFIGDGFMCHACFSPKGLRCNFTSPLKETQGLSCMKCKRVTIDYSPSIFVPESLLVIDQIRSSINLKFDSFQIPKDWKFCWPGARSFREPIYI